ncbi:MAG: hypothetical protein Q8N23_22405 [Archangium sp.]|nr:hypothetical protein [Archangium sp.]MDP3573775.1 hypothetical protein [Archangium sp.]
MASFSDALESNPAPTALGDVSLRYEPSMLIGETAKRKATWRSSALWLGGVAFLLFSVGALILQADFSTALVLVVLGAAGIGAAVLMERFEKRQRRFVANFGTVSLRLDFTSPIAGHALTLVVPFDSVRAAELLPQADGASCLCVDFERDGGLLREVLVAHIPPSQQAEAERLERVLKGAFGLGKKPPVIDPDASSFESEEGPNETC